MKNELLKIITAGIIAFAISAGLTSCEVQAADVLAEEWLYTMCEEIAAGRIQPEFVEAVIYAESSGDASAHNGPCIGAMGVNKNVWAELIEEKAAGLNVDPDLYDPYLNITVGTQILVDLFAETDDPYMVLMTYNMGPAKAEALAAQGRWTKYATGICKKAAQLERQHGK